MSLADFGTSLAASGQHLLEQSHINREERTHEPMVADAIVAVVSLVGIPNREENIRLA